MKLWAPVTGLGERALTIFSLNRFRGHLGPQIRILQVLSHMNTSLVSFVTTDNMSYDKVLFYFTLQIKNEDLHVYRAAETRHMTWVMGPVCVWCVCLAKAATH